MPDIVGKYVPLSRRCFPDTQFIFTTHDEIWLRHMEQKALIKGRNFAHFRTWTVDLGPTEWHDFDVWAELEGYLVRDDVRAAAALLRHYLEHFSKEACDRLRASVEFRGDAQLIVGDLLPSATSAFGDLLKKGKAAANSWNQKDVVDRIGAIELAFVELKTKTGSDSWQINTAVHFNEWGRFEENELLPVVTAFRAFTSAFACSTCNEMYFVAPDRGPKRSFAMRMWRTQPQPHAETRLMSEGRRQTASKTCNEIRHEVGTLGVSQIGQKVSRF